MVSVHAGSNEDLSKEEHPTIHVELDGVVGDRHRSFERVTWEGDKQPEGTTRSGNPLESTTFSKAAKLTRGVVGVVEAAGAISAGDEVTVEIYETPAWLQRS